MQLAVIIEQLGDARRSHHAIREQILEDLTDRDGAMERPRLVRGADELWNEAIEGIHGGGVGHDG